MASNVFGLCRFGVRVCLLIDQPDLHIHTLESWSSLGEVGTPRLGVVHIYICAQEVSSEDVWLKFGSRPQLEVPDLSQLATSSVVQ